MNLYLDASALVKRYVAEPGSDLVRDAMDGADGWFMCRVGFVEATRAVTLTAGQTVARAVREDWPAFGVIDVDQGLVEHASILAVNRELGSIDALHLAAALVLPRDELAILTWDRRLHDAARAEGLGVIPASLG